MSRLLPLNVLKEKLDKKKLSPLCCMTLCTDISHFQQAVCLSIILFLCCYYICLFNKSLFFLYGNYWLITIYNNYWQTIWTVMEKHFILKLKSRKPAKSEGTHIFHTQPIFQQYKPHNISRTDTSVQTSMQTHTHTYYVHFCQAKSLKLILNPQVIPFISAHRAIQAFPTCLSAVS